MVFFSNPLLSLCRRHCQHRWPDGEHQISGQRASHFSKPLCLKMTLEAVELPLNVWHVPFFVFFCWSLAKHLYQMELYEWFCLGFELLPVSSNKYKHYWCQQAIQKVIKTYHMNVKTAAWKVYTLQRQWFEVTVLGQHAQVLADGTSERDCWLSGWRS